MPYKNPDKKRANDAEYRANNRNRRRASDAAYRAIHKEEKRAANAAYHAANKAEILARAVRYRAFNRERCNAQSRAYYAAHKPEQFARNTARKAMILGATVGNFAEIAEIYRKAQEDPRVRCYLCGKLIPMGHRHIDHIMPMFKGGANRPSNLAATCDGCNLKKGAKHPNEVGVLL